MQLFNCKVLDFIFAPKVMVTKYELSYLLHTVVYLYLRKGFLVLNLLNAREVPVN